MGDGPRPGGRSVSRRRDYYGDPAAPRANSLRPGGSAAVLDAEGRVLLQRRADNGNWAMPGGIMEIGETLGDAVIREVAEETGINIELTGIIGVYTDPRHVMAWEDGEVRQQFTITFSARPTGGRLRTSHESTQVGWFNRRELDDLPMHPTQRLRLGHVYTPRATPYIG